MNLPTPFDLAPSMPAAARSPFSNAGSQSYGTSGLCNKHDLRNAFRSPRLIQRMAHANWFEIVVQGKPGRATLYSRESVDRALLRIKNGERPPMLPCELRQRKGNGGAA